MSSSFSLAMRLAVRLAAVAAVLCVVGAGAGAQQRVGISSAVNPQALATPPGAAAAQPLLIGQDVVFNERIATAAKGQTQLLFVDESSMTVGPNSDLTIDQFVFDPTSGTGKLAMSATRGLLRYVGGKLSKHDGAVTLRTSTATLAVRGGAFIVNITYGGQTEVIFIYGQGLSVAGLNGVIQTLSRPGFQITISAAGVASAPQRVPPGVLAQLTTELDGQNGSNGGAATIPTDAGATEGTATLTQTLQQSLQSAINTLATQPTTINPQSAQTTYNQQTSQVDVVCGASGNCVAFTGNGQAISGNVQQTSSTSTTGSGTTVTTGPPPPPPQITDVYGGQVKGTTDPPLGFANLAAPTNAASPNGAVAFVNGALTYPSGSPQAGVFSGNFGNFGAISFSLPLCTTTAAGCTAGLSGTSNALGTLTGTSFMSADDSFFYATITPVGQPNDRLFVYGGSPVDQTLSPNFYSPTGSTRIYAFTVQPDAALQASTPFVPAQAGGNLPNAAVSPFYIAAPASTAIGDTSTAAAARGLQASLAINGVMANQQSAIAVTTGTIASQNGQPVFSGALRGSSMLSANGTPTTLAGTVSTPVDGNGVSFYGGSGISGFVLDQSPSGVTATPLSGAPTSYGFAQPALPTTVPGSTPGAVPTTIGTDTQTTQTLTGSFGGLMSTTAQATPYIVAGTAQIATNATNNTVAATLSGNAQPFGAEQSPPSAGVTALTLQYGSSGSPNQAFVDDSHFAAAESATTPQQITINGTPSQPAGQLYLVSSGAAGQPTQLLPAGASFCQCQYLQWGYWGGSLTTPGGESGTSRIDAGNINTWVAGSPTPLADLQNLETMSATASYTGAALGSVFNNGASYVAAGGFNGTYNFGSQSGTFAITNFDGHNFVTAGNAPLNGANYTFAAVSNGLGGTVNGTFYGPNAAETGGNFAFRSIAGPTYLASGIFAGKQ
jgi:trimeric autotransporter adhesin